MPPGEASAADQQPVRWHAATRELVGGVLAGAVNVTSGYPFDTMKVRLQASDGVYEGMADCFSHIWRTEGVRGFFRGLSSPLIGGAAETGVNYLVYSRVLDMFKPQQQQQQQQQSLLPAVVQQMRALEQQQQQQQLLQQQDRQHSSSSSSSSEQHLPPLRAVLVAGAVAGVALSVILAPTELIKCRMQMAQFDSPLRCLANLIETEGLRGLTRGFLPTLAREIPGNALFFTVYEGLRRSWPGRPGAAAGHGSSSSSGTSSSSSSSNSSSKSSSSGSLAAAWQVVLDAGGAIVCGGMAGVVMWSTVLPLDVAKTRIQTAQPGTPWDTGVLRQLAMLWKEGGRRSLWAGLAPTVARAFPANACQWLAWEVAMRQLLPPAFEEEPDHSSTAGQQQQLQNGTSKQQDVRAVTV
uniref:Mitochondrial carrier protein n=1 Tax=Tetradesmus obliquus TaxID=3088 RepID=A0A383W3J7_TETOB|eukprot:jgi/Sobl393_1/13998/SZX71692.1